MESTLTNRINYNLVCILGIMQSLSGPFVILNSLVQYLLQVHRIIKSFNSEVSLKHLMGSFQS